MRPARPVDVGVLAGLAERAVGEQADRRGGPVWSVRETRALPADDSLAAAVADPAQLVLVATLDDVPLGYAVARTELLRDGSTLGVIDDLAVDAEARGVSLGAQLMDAVVAWCTARGCRGIDAHALPGNRETKNFFESFGFTARLLVVHHRLADG